MSAYRLLVVSTRYWPHTDDRVERLQLLLDGLRRSGIASTVLAGKFGAHWPTEIVHRETRVVRPIHVPRSEWARGRYYRGLTKWIRDHLSEFDAVYVDSARDEAVAAMDAHRHSRVPVVIRVAGTGSASDVAAWQTSRNGSRFHARCLAADRLIAANRSAQQLLIAAGADAKCVARIDGGFPVFKRVTQQQSTEIRSALASLNADLTVPEQSCVIASLSRLRADTGITTLARAICRLGTAAPHHRYWMLGDGPLREQLYDDFKHAAVKHCVFMPGSFDNSATVLSAADVFVLPGEEDGLEHYLPTAVALGLPVVAVDTPAVRDLLPDPGDSIRFFAAGSIDSLCEVLTDTLETLPTSRKAAERYRAARLAGEPIERNIVAHAKLFYSLASGRATAGVAS